LQLCDDRRDVGRPRRCNRCHGRAPALAGLQVSFAFSRKPPSFAPRRLACQGFLGTPGDYATFFLGDHGHDPDREAFGARHWFIEFR